MSKHSSQGHPADLQITLILFHIFMSIRAHFTKDLEEVVKILAVVSVNYVVLAGRWEVPLKNYRIQ